MCPGECGTEIYVAGHRRNQEKDYRCHKCGIAFSYGRWAARDPEIVDDAGGTIHAANLVGGSAD